MSHPALTLTVRIERWPIAGSFTISRGAKTEAVVVVAELSDGSHHGRGECGRQSGEGIRRACGRKKNGSDRRDAAAAERIKGLASGYLEKIFTTKNTKGTKKTKTGRQLKYHDP